MLKFIVKAPLVTATVIDGGIRKVIRKRYKEEFTTESETEKIKYLLTQGKIAVVKEAEDYKEPQQKDIVNEKPAETPVEEKAEIKENDNDGDSSTDAETPSRKGSKTPSNKK